MSQEPTEDQKITVTEGWLHDIKAALKDPSRKVVRYECIKYVESKLKADTLAHQCPEWDGAFISPNDPEWDACICLIKRTANLKLVTINPQQVREILTAGGELFDREVEPTGVAYMDGDFFSYKTAFGVSKLDLYHDDITDWWVDSEWMDKQGIEDKV